MKRKNLKILKSFEPEDDPSHGLKSKRIRTEYHFLEDGKLEFKRTHTKFNYSEAKIRTRDEDFDSILESISPMFEYHKNLSQKKENFEDPMGFVRYLFDDVRSMYNLKEDSTLTSQQQTMESFHKIGSNNFRAPSNPTVEGYSTGYHESVPTDTFNHLKNSTNSILPRSSKNEFNKVALIKVDSELLSAILEIADGYRTDTAQTVLSASKGQPAGHSGSNVHQKGQSDAHDLLRRAVLDVLTQSKLNEDGCSVKSLATLFGAITVTSLAPADIANHAQYIEKLKAGNKALKNWEQNRNEAKNRVHSVYSELNSTEKDFIKTKMKNFLNTTQEGVSIDRRIISNTSATTPTRSTSAYGGGAAFGGKYIDITGNSSFDNPLSGPPTDPTKFGYYFTQPFRGERQPKSK